MPAERSWWRNNPGGITLRRLVTLVLSAWAAAHAMAGQAPATFPAQQRPAGDPALIERGNSIYGVYCRSCHGPDLRGGDLGGPNLLRSQLALNDLAGEAIGKVIREGRVPQGGGTPMPPVPMSDADVGAVAAFIHSVLRSSQPQGAPPRGAAVELNLLVGNARAGERYFGRQCASCHSTTGDMAGIATRYSSIETLQNNWVAGRRLASGFGGPPPSTSARSTVRVTVKFADGRSESGVLRRLDDFVVSFTGEDGKYRSYTRRSAGITEVKVDDPLARHRELWTILTDKDMHDVTAYLATLK
jgi:cytochrome c oxidase cbb3-type subunit 3